MLAFLIDQLQLWELVAIDGQDSARYSAPAGRDPSGVRPKRPWSALSPGGRDARESEGGSAAGTLPG